MSSPQLYQIIPTEVCLSCDVCCRFLEEDSPLAPIFTEQETERLFSQGIDRSLFQPQNDGRSSQIKLIPYRDYYICPFFEPKTQKCKIYSSRPLDCRLYPFTIMFSEDKNNVVLGVDMLCPFSEEHFALDSFQRHFKQVVEYVESDDVRSQIIENWSLIGEYQDTVKVFHTFSDRFFGMRLSPLTLDQKPLFDQYCSQSNLPLSSYAFASHFIWKDFFDFFYVICKIEELNDNAAYTEYLCIFAKQGDDYFLPILPIPCRINCPNYIKIVIDVYKYMLTSNRNPVIARIENVPEHCLTVFRKEGFRFIQKETEYIYKTRDLYQLKGNRYKQQRNSYNALLAKYNAIRYEPYQAMDQDACLELYERWRKTRAEKYDDVIYQALLEDSKSAHRIGITHAQALDLVGRVVKIDGELCAYTFGYALNSETFCILFEISDLHIKGLSQYIYREFCKELSSSYKWINAMSDSGLENIKRVKLSYHPKQLIQSYNIYEHGTYLP